VHFWIEKESFRSNDVDGWGRWGRRGWGREREVGEEGERGWGAELKKRRGRVSQ
jgi:hypothetical protein